MISPSEGAYHVGNDQLFRAVFRPSGIARGRGGTMQHMFNLARAISKQPLPDRDGEGIISQRRIAGGVAADAITDNGMRLAELGPP